MMLQTSKDPLVQMTVPSLRYGWRWNKQRTKEGLSQGEDRSRLDGKERLGIPGGHQEVVQGQREGKARPCRPKGPPSEGGQEGHSDCATVPKSPVVYLGIGPLLK